MRLGGGKAAGQDRIQDILKNGRIQPVRPNKNQERIAGRKEDRERLMNNIRQGAQFIEDFFPNEVGL